MSFFSPEVRRNPYPLYELVRDASPVLHHADADLFLVFDHESVRRVLGDHETFTSAVSPSGVTSQWLIFSDPPRHTKLRALIARAFAPRAIAELEPHIRRLSLSLLDPLIARGELDLVLDYAMPLPLMVICELLGVAAPDFPELRRWSDVILGLAHSVAGDPRAAAAERAFLQVTEEMRGYLAEILAQRRSNPRDDLFTRLLFADVDGAHLSEEEILGFFQLLLIAGHETTTNLISNAVLSFSEHPGELAALRASPLLLAGAVEEVLRYRSPVQATFRGTRRATELRGATIPEGKLVLAMIGSANRDRGVFVDADRFDITRAPNPHVAFGQGLHFCIGAALARLEGRIALEHLLLRGFTIELATDTWEPREAFHVHGPSSLPVRVRGAGS